VSSAAPNTPTMYINIELFQMLRTPTLNADAIGVGCNDLL